MADTEAVTRASAIAAIEHVAQNNCGSREREAEEMLVAAPAAVAQEPFAWHVCSVNADGSLSLEHAAQWEEAAHEHINDAITEHDIADAGSWVVRPAYHSPQPAQADALDAARWRWLSEHIRVSWDEGKLTSLVRIVSEQHRQSLNASVDRMMAGDWSDAAHAAQEGK